MKDERILKDWLASRGAKMTIHHGHYYGLTASVRHKGKYVSADKSVGGRFYDYPLLDWRPMLSVTKRQALVEEFMRMFSGKEFRDYDGRHMFVLPSSISEMALQLAAEGRMP